MIVQPLTQEKLTQTSLAALLADYPLLESVLLEQGIEFDPAEEVTLAAKLAQWSALRHHSAEGFLDQMLARINELGALLASTTSLEQLEIVAGRDKSGQPEQVERILLKRGDLLAIVGPTGSGKSRLLADIEWLATGDTPSGRMILIDGQPSADRRFSTGGDQLIAQLSQTMSFVLDATVEELLSLHVESRGMAASVVIDTIEAANELSGEPFFGTTALTSLSGGQTRALMVADTALVCRSPIVLIDEIENAGIDRRAAFNLLLSQDKIVLSATHDPLLALLAPRRLCMRNGAMHSLHDRTNEEEALLADLEALDDIHAAIRNQLRQGSKITPIDSHRLRRNVP
ncbi:ATP-binding cassette domain-containing protein [uncultured Desulfobulbus sp.]|uniref:ATP-binding cassette domain-containing protein n=1 Tax=uncultured Desulfobulbus sp. TaxID=239745 RepID=UPI0029C77405|nr:ATP-binding cassette domain-containing protein [uncultured Desulfobulbus sp.]